jgi:hypothetical protein
MSDNTLSEAKYTLRDGCPSIREHDIRLNTHHFKAGEFQNLGIQRANTFDFKLEENDSIIDFSVSSKSRW